MSSLDPSARPSVDQETLDFLRDLTTKGIFNLQYDAWAFGIALALNLGLEPATLGQGKEQLTVLSTLPDETRFALKQATLARLGTAQVPNLIEYVSGLAVAGLRHMRTQVRDLSIQESINWVLQTTMVSS